jgi:hypothetical protein
MKGRGRGLFKGTNNEELRKSPKKLKEISHFRRKIIWDLPNVMLFFMRLFGGMLKPLHDLSYLHAFVKQTPRLFGNFSDSCALRD